MCRRYMYLSWKLTVTLNTFTTGEKEKIDLCVASQPNEFFSTCLLKGEINVHDQAPHVIELDWLSRHHPTSHASTELASRVDVMSRDGAEQGSEQIKHIRRFQIDMFMYVLFWLNSSTV
ncbi:hypothetical protein TNCV_2129851 [Trichonephila clavipes]|nr:hypothetical protein TNCV_2129851 [Trichonephila clavipes]